ncbi:MAG: type IVB secretion system protein IcmH/DotU [bacterium]
MTKLSELCTNLFSLIVQLKASDEFGDPERLRSKVHGLFDTLKQKGEELGLQSEAVRDADYAMTAFIDEIIATAAWQHKSVWLAKKLQFEKYGTTNAGEDFFKKLAELQRDASANAAQLEVFYLCLVLGFEGKYKLLGREKLKEIVDALASDLGVSKNRRARILSPRWQRTPEIIRVARQRTIPVAAVLLTCLVVAVVLFFVASGKIDKFADAVKRQIHQHVLK